jgi:hypothetical protein
MKVVDEAFDNNENVNLKNAYQEYHYHHETFMSICNVLHNRYGCSVLSFVSVQHKSRNFDEPHLPKELIPFYEYTTDKPAQLMFVYECERYC